MHEHTEDLASQAEASKHKALLLKIVIPVTTFLVIGAFVAGVAYFYYRSVTGPNSTQESASSTTSQTILSSDSSTSISSESSADEFSLVGPNTTDTSKVSSTYEPLSGYIRRYTSTELGISFTVFYYKLDSPFQVVREANKVWINTLAGDDYHKGQSVEVFAKDPKDSLKEAIQKRFLLGYAPEKCFVVSRQNNTTSLEHAEINYPIDASNSEGPWWQNAKDCPTEYAQTNGLRYFAYDHNHPGRFAFIDIGQYVVLGNANYEDWASTLEFIN